MKEKVIWYCHPYAGSPAMGMSYRPYYLSLEFARAGHRPYIISPDFHHLLHQPVQQKEKIVQKAMEGVDYIFLKCPAYRGNGLKRLLNMLAYASGLRRRSKAIMDLTGKPDVIIVSSAHPFHYLAMARFARKIKAKLIFEVRDLWPLSLQMLLNVSPYHPLSLYLSYIERRAYHEADYVVSVLDNAFPYMSERGLDAARFKLIPNGVSLESQSNKVALTSAIASKIHAEKQAGKFLVGYAGAMGKPNALQYLIEAMHILEAEGLAVHCFLIGEGGLKASLQQMLIDEEIQNVSFFPAVNKHEVLSFFELMDLLYLGWNNQPLYQYGVSPNKLYDYLLAGKPILESGGAKESLVEKLRAGLHCEAENSAVIADHIRQMVAMPMEERQLMSKNGQQAVREYYSYQFLADGYQTLF